ncbi:MAG TPA: glycoside hydrolase family 3 N-terminal domain-containing protein [Bacteroidota bacterium]|nr:glycoside hydrolase family 3 N-terminal domain-containing protein [Bacteroidota bacterium]
MSQNLAAEKAVRSEAEAAYRNSALPVDDRVADLLARMTLEEKVAQMLCIWGEKKNLLLTADGALDVAGLGRRFGHGIGQIARLSDTGGGKPPREMAALANAIQKYLVEETRLGIPAVFHEECLHGLAAPEATSYPQPIGLAATFDTRLVEEIYSSIAEETRARGAHQALTPVVDVAREPRWGRVEETFGEDPYLVAEMGIAAVRGFQGDGSLRDGKHLIATLKHFAAHGQPESGTNCAPVNVSERLLRDTFLYTFREVIKRAGVRSVMASYNEIDGVPSHANRWLLGDVLRTEWGFRGTVVSDYYAITELHRRDDVLSHMIAADKAEAALLALRAGVNIELPDPDCYPLLGRLVAEGRVAEEELDAMVGPLLAQKFQLGLFEDPYVDPGAFDFEASLESGRTRALKAALETITLLKNEGAILPLRPGRFRTIAVIGPNADRPLLGGYSGTPRHNVTVLEGIRARAGKDATVLYSEGCKITVGGSWNEDAVTLPDPAADRGAISEAVATAKRADCVILALGDNEQTSREAWSKVHLGDRASLDLFGAQNDLVKAVAATGKPIVVLLFSGRPHTLAEARRPASAILACWYLGQETGTAVASVLWGDSTPGGKLPISFPRSAGHVPCYYNYKPSARRGYLCDDVTALFPFGFGLSYTTFALRNLRLEKSVMRRDEKTRVTVEVTNTGALAGDEVVQMYVRDNVSSVTRPVKELRGFQRVRLAPGETRTVTLPLGPEHLAFTTIDRSWAVEPGDFDIMVGSSSRDEDLARVTLRVE